MKQKINTLLYLLLGGFLSLVTVTETFFKRVVFIPRNQPQIRPSINNNNFDNKVKRSADTLDVLFHLIRLKILKHQR